MATFGARFVALDGWSLVSRCAATVVVAALGVWVVAEAGPAAAAPSGPESEVQDWTEAGAWNGLTAPDAVAAVALASVRGEAVEDLSQRTVSSQTFALPDGRWRSDMSSGPEWVATGEDPSTAAGWARLDTDLVASSDGTFRPVAHGGALVFAGAGGDGGDVVSGVTADGEPFALSWDGVLPEPIVEGNAIRYVGVEPDIDLVFAVNATGFEQFFVANTPEALESVGTLSLGVSASESQLSRVGDTLVARGDDGARVAQVSDVAAWDAQADAARLEPVALMAPVPSDEAEPTVEQDLRAVPEEVEVPAGVAVTSEEASIEIDVADVPFDEADQFPVVIDPSVNLSFTFDTYVSNVSTVDKSGETELRVGTPDSGASKYRSYLNIDVAPILGKKVSQATLKLYNFHSWSCGARAWEVWSTSTTSSATRWSNMPAFSTKYDAPTATKGYSSSCADGYVTADVTVMAQNWSGGTVASKGIGLKATSETDNYSWKRFNSGNAASNKPVLSVVYNSYPSTPASSPMTAGQYNWYPSSTATNKQLFVNTTRPHLAAVVTDPDGGTVQGVFSVYSGTTTSGSVVWSKAYGPSVASGGVSRWQPSQNMPALSNGSTYTAQAWASDGSLLSKSAKELWTFTVDTAAPGAVTLTSDQFTDGQWVDAVPASVSATVTATDAVKFEYKIDGVAKTAVAATSQKATLTGLPKSGGHKIEVRAIDRANNAGAWKTVTYGFGGADLLSPTPGLKSTDVFVVEATAPSASTGTVTPSIWYRAAGDADATLSADGSTTGWTMASELAPVSANTEVHVTESWHAAAAATQLGSGRVPALLDVQVCFTYDVAAVTRCTWNSSVTEWPTVVRVPHAFGDSYPTADAGPGQVALWTGEFNTSVTDVSVPGYVGDLSVSRSYSTLAGQSVVAPVFGPGWSASFDGTDVGVAGLYVSDTSRQDGTIALVDGEGEALVFRQPGGKRVEGKIGVYTAVDDDTASSGTRLEKTGWGADAARLIFTDVDGSVTTFGYVDGLAERTWRPMTVTEPGSSKATSFTRDSAGRITRILAPTADGVTCPATGNLNPGCRALHITYGETTTGTEVAGQIKTISYEAFNPDGKHGAGVETDEVAAYEYDSDKRLVKVTDTRTGLSVRYTYAAGVTSTSGQPLLAGVTPAGEAPWTLTYGASARDGKSLVSVDRASTENPATLVQTARFIYDVPLAGETGLPEMSQTLTQAWGGDMPAYGAAVFGPDRPVGSTPTGDDWSYADVQYTDTQGRVTVGAAYGAGDWQYAATRYDGEGRVIASFEPGATAQLRELTTQGVNASAAVIDSYATLTRYNEAVPAPSATTWTDADGVEHVIAESTILIEAGSLVTDTYEPAREVGGALVREHTHTDYDQGAPNSRVNPSTGIAFALPTTVTVSQVDALSPAETSTGTVLSRTINSYGLDGSEQSTAPTSGWMLGQATAVTTDMNLDGVADDDDITMQTVYDVEGRVIEQRRPGSTGTDAATLRSGYYTVEAQMGVFAACGGQPAWAGLACMTTTGESTPTIPVQHTTKYNLYLAPATVVETMNGVTRTTATTFGPAGRTDTVTTTVTGLDGSEQVPPTQTLYDDATGRATAVVTLNADDDETARISQTFDSWGREVAYTDTDGSTTTTRYDTAGRVASVTDSYGITSTYTYDGDSATGAERRGLATGLLVAGGVDGALAYAAAYNADGAMSLQLLPGGVRQDVTFGRAGDRTGLAYTYSSAGVDTEVMAWTLTSDVHGRTTSMTSGAGISEDALGRTTTYAYDEADRLTDVIDVIGLECTTRTYGFDVRGNRTSQTTATFTDADCTTAGSSVAKSWGHDGADRVEHGATIAGVTGGAYVYDALGRQLTVPAVDTVAGDSDIQIGYYDTDAVHTLTRGRDDHSVFTLDAVGRRSTETTTGTTVTETLERHYSDASDNPTWVEATIDAQTTKSWYGASLGGDLALTLTTAAEGTVVEVAIADPLGSIATTVTIADDGKLDFSKTGVYDEYGNTITTATSASVVDYGWLGAKERATNPATGLVLMGARLYNPVTGLFTSVDPVPGGNTTAYTYPQDPINKMDTTGKSWWSNVKSKAKSRWNSLRSKSSQLWAKHGRQLVHRGINAALGAAIVLAAGAVCATGIGCLLAAGAAFSVMGGMIGVASHAAADRYIFRRRTSAREAISYAYGPGQSAIRGLGMAAWRRRR